MYETVFISHSGYDEAIGEEIEDVIRDGGYRAWRFQRDMQGGNLWDPQLPANIERCDIFLFAATEHSRNSEICEKEWQHAALKQKPFVPVVLNGVYPPSPVNALQCVLFDGLATSGARLISALQNAQPLPWEKIPDDWKTWEGKTKSELSPKNSDSKEIPLPRIKRELTDMEKEDFLYESIMKIRDYFGQALGAFENSDPRVKTRIHDKTNMKSFNCEVHLDGKQNKRCTIWIYNEYGMNGIAYYETNRHEANFGKQPYNELVQVAELDGNPALKFTFGSGMFTQLDDCQICTVDKASECLWKYFTRDFNEDSTRW